MCGGVVPQYAITEMETWSCLSVPPQAFHAERPRRKAPPDQDFHGNQMFETYGLAPPKQSLQKSVIACMFQAPGTVSSASRADHPGRSPIFCRKINEDIIFVCMRRKRIVGETIIDKLVSW